VILSARLSARNYSREPGRTRCTQRHSRGHDAAAPTYAQLFRDTLRDSPLDRANLGAFAEVVTASGDGQVADLGCGPGHITAHLSRWSIIHTPPQELPIILTEFHRVLAPGGHLLAGFSASEDPSHPTQVFDHTVASAYRW
jgi:SAM-dependent methyltransferase